MGEGETPSLLCLLLPVAGKKAGPRVTRVRELTLPHTTQEGGPCTPHGQHTTADSAVGVSVLGEPVLRA